tara:strand:- start:1592 stop:2281 length:690 start_codon:yes stop_codon:yes gene_type:complete
MKKLILICILIINSCSYPEIIRDELVYQNDFENDDLTNIDGGGIIMFNNTKVIGNFNNDGFTLHLDNVGNHDYIFISFDLYIHGSWDGNFNGFPNNDKPDKWIMEYKPEMDLFKDLEFDKFITTFSNSPCWTNYCLKQSYPNTYPSDNNPKTGSFETNLDRICQDSFFGGPSSMYKIEKGFRSNGNAIVLRFYDELYQPNAIDKDGVPQEKCDESWSMDNIKIRVIKYK